MLRLSGTSVCDATEAAAGWYLLLHSGNSFMFNSGKVYGYTLRCLRD